MRQRLSEFTVVGTPPVCCEEVDLREPSVSSHGRYWYNVHVVLVVAERDRIADRAALAIVRLPGSGGHIPAKGLSAGPTQPIEVPGVILAALASIGLGLVIGPEAPLIAIGGGLGLLRAAASGHRPLKKKTRDLRRQRTKGRLQRVEAEVLGSGICPRPSPIPFPLASRVFRECLPSLSTTTGAEAP